MESFKADIELHQPFGRIDISATGNTHLQMVCFAKHYKVIVCFQQFDALESRSEFFDRRNAQGISIPRLPGSEIYFPITYIPYEGFKGFLSSYESVNASESTRLWRFLSETNFVEVYSRDLPDLRKEEYTDIAPL